MKYIKQGLRDYFFIIKENKKNIIDEINSVAINRIFLFNLFNALYQICNIFLYSKIQYKISYYIVSISFMMFSMLTIYHIIELYKQATRQSRFHIRVNKFLKIYNIIFLIFFALLSLLDFMMGNGIFNFLVYCFVLEICSSYSLKKYLVFITPITIYTIILNIMFGFNTSLLVYIIIFSLFSIIVSQFLYLYRYNYLKTIDELKKENRTLYKNLEYDKLTKLFNRYGHNNRLESLIPEVIETKKQVAVFMMDIDYFKKINDSEGHQHGDLILSTIAHSIQRMVNNKLPKIEFISRYGGEEFFALATDINYEETKEIAEAFRECVENLKLERKYTKISEYVTISVGASYGRIKNQKDLESMIFSSDEALYRSKQNGRNRKTVFRFKNKDID